jgi:acyl-CoA dehydrogenase
MVPVAITVEGANILTRSLITFAQGALRSHPYLYKEIKALQEKDEEMGLAAFDEAFIGHVGYSLDNAVGAFVHNLTGGMFVKTPRQAAPVTFWYQQLGRASRTFSLVADLTVALLGGGLKTRQKLTGRMADALSELYLLSCVLKRFEDDGRKESDQAIVALAMKNGLHRFQNAIAGTIDNFPNWPARMLMRWIAFPLGRPFRPAADWEQKKVVALALEPGEVRERLTREIFISRDPNDATGLLEHTLPKVIAAEEALKKIEKAVRRDQIRRYHGRDWIAEAERNGVVTAEEGKLVREVEDLTQRVIAVDHFDPEELRPNYRTLSNTTSAARAAAE